MRGGVPNEMSSSCRQSDVPRPLGGYQPMIEPSSPGSAWPCYSSVIPKPEPMDQEERNDSGINSGSDFHSSSPESDRSENIPYPLPSTTQANRSPYYPIPIMDELTSMAYQPFTSSRAHFTQNRRRMLTRPNSEPTASTRNVDSATPSGSNVKVKREVADQEATPSPSSSVPMDDQQPCCSKDNTDNDDPLKQLQMSLEQGSFLASNRSPKDNEGSGDSTKSDNDTDEFDEHGLKVPKVNSHGKVRLHKCKQCDFVTDQKHLFWEHNKVHIKIEKLLTCPKCPFVTEYKHHLEYHLRNHAGSKPFKCPKCTYSCVNKSMLNSHLKSHSNVYQYRCADCNYVTKYCHSLKLHLRKYGHKPAMVLNPDGTPNPLPIIDVYGTRRGPKVKCQEQRPVDQLSAPPEPVLFPLNQFMLNAPHMQLPMPGFPFFPAFPGAMPPPALIETLERFMREKQAMDNVDELSRRIETEMQVLDLSKPEEKVQRNRRKGRAFKLAPDHENSSDDEEETTMFSNVEVVHERGADAETPASEERLADKEGDSNNNNNYKGNYHCQYCEMSFGDAVIHTIHMGYHGYNNPFTCNMCGEECNDKVSFFVHIARTSHS